MNVIGTFWRATTRELIHILWFGWSEWQLSHFHRFTVYKHSWEPNLNYRRKQKVNLTVWTNGAWLLNSTLRAPTLEAISKFPSKVIFIRNSKLLTSVDITSLSKQMTMFHFIYISDFITIASLESCSGLFSQEANSNKTYFGSREVRSATPAQSNSGVLSNVKSHDQVKGIWVFILKSVYKIRPSSVREKYQYNWNWVHAGKQGQLNY